MAGRPGGLDDLQLLPRRDTGEDPRGADARGEPLGREVGQFTAGDHIGVVMRHVELAGDGQTRQPVVPGDHHHPDAGGSTPPDGLPCGRPKRVGEPDESQEIEVCERRPRNRNRVSGGHLTAGQRQHTQAFSGQCGGLRMPGGHL